MAKKKDLIVSYSDEFEDSLIIITLQRSRKLRHCCSAAFFTEAYVSYNPDIPMEFMELISWREVCRKFVKMYSIKFKEDFFYLIRHPEFTEPPECATKKNTLRFNFDCEIDEQRKACEYLSDIKPRNRIIPVEKMMKQLLIKEQNEFFLNQNAMRLMRKLQNMNGACEEITDTTRQMVDLIWDIAGASREIGRAL